MAYFISAAMIYRIVAVDATNDNTKSPEPDHIFFVYVQYDTLDMDLHFFPKRYHVLLSGVHLRISFSNIKGNKLISDNNILFRSKMFQLFPRIVMLSHWIYSQKCLFISKYGPYKFPLLLTRGWFLLEIFVFSIHIDHIRQVNLKFYNVKEVGYILKLCQPKNGDLDQEMYVSVMDPVISHIVHRFIPKLQRQPDFLEFKAS